MRKLILPLCLIVAAVGVTWTAVQYTQQPQPLVVQGQVEATQIDLASKIPGRVIELHVKNGDQVKKGDLIFVLDSPEIRAKLSQAQAAVDAAGSMRDKAFKGARVEEIQAARNLRDKARAGLELAEKTHVRIQRLFNDGVLPAQKLDEAVARLKAARETAKAANASYTMARKGAREEDKSASVAMVNQAAGARAEVEAYLAETRMVSPIDGEIADVIVDPGELAATGYPVVSIVDLSDVWVTFNLREDFMAQITMGKEITARFPALGNRELKLRINYIAALGDFATWHSTKASGDFDLKTFEVRAVPLAPESGEAMPVLRPGMGAVVLWENQGSAG
ncbi:MAG: efflux RND transporter periplasmic adaptor subunit [Desulfobacterales bacterium]|nr:efflux RND transporter periplasmic adaptor subunit [Desulfobacterales bacterium]